MSTAGISIVIPFFAIMVVGFLAGKFRLLPDGSSEVLSRFVFTISMPALIFLAVSRVSVEDFFNWPFLGALGGGMMILFISGIFISRHLFPATLTANALHGLAAMFSSTAYIGLPLLLTLFGDAALAPGIIGAVITGSFFAPIAIVITEIDQGRLESRQLWKPFLSALSSPLVFSTAGGLLVSGLGLGLPDIVVSFCEILGGAFVPCALFAAGLFISGYQMRSSNMEVGWLVFVKLLIHPLITWWLAYHVFELEGILPAVAVIQAALPCGVPVFVLAQQYKTFVPQSSAVIAWSTALSVLSLPILFLILDI